MSGGGILPVSGKAKRKMGSAKGSSMRPSSTILASCFSRDLAWRTRLAYVPQLAMKALMCAISSCCFSYCLTWFLSCSDRVSTYWS